MDVNNPLKIVFSYVLIHRHIKFKGDGYFTNKNPMMMMVINRVINGAING